jgi:hypothetical protein
MTGNPKIDLTIVVILTVLLATSEALGRSKRIKPNGVAQFVAMFVAAGCKGILDLGVAGPAKAVIGKVEPVMAEAIERALDSPAPPGLEHHQEQPQVDNSNTEDDGEN